MYYSDHYGIKCDIQQTCIVNPKEDKNKTHNKLGIFHSKKKKR